MALNIACASDLGSPDSNLAAEDEFGCPQSPSAPEISERTFCSNVISPTDPVSISGVAEFQRREISSLGLCKGLCGVDSSNFPIPLAEVVVKDSSGNIVQCGLTDASGNFSINVERSSTSHTIEVYSRADNSTYKASVLKNHDTMEAYSISSSFTPSSTVSGISMVGDYTNTLEGGAFNILYNIYRANLKLSSSTASCGFSGCSDYDASAKVQAFWAPGCSPAKYFSGVGDVSFYIGGTNRLYILGGSNGNVSNSDTDHFDDSIVLHEYGHFIEDNYTKSESPGGAHDGDSVIDPRLAFSESFATFFGMLVQEDQRYIDTYGDITGSTGFFFYYDAENNEDLSGDPLDPSDGCYALSSPPAGCYTVDDGEGIFREFNLVRVFWDMHDDATETANEVVFNDTVDSADFREYWAVLTGTNGIKNSNNTFLNAELFFDLYGSLAGATDISSVLSNEKMVSPGTASPNINLAYATPLSTSGTCTYSIVPKKGNLHDIKKSLTFSDGSAVYSYWDLTNQHASNDFYEIEISSSGSYKFDLDPQSGTGDLDMYLYINEYVFATGNSVLAEGIEAGSSTPESFTVSLTPGKYLLNVHSYTGRFDLGETESYNSNTYKLELNDTELCP
ncbi:MAG: carboxypeptidase-like regulatory domain-containing protein [Bdellovibrionales bacterium]